MRSLWLLTLFLAGCESFGEVVGTTQELASSPVVQDAIADTMEHMPDIAADPANPLGWIGLAGGLTGLAAAVYTALNKKPKEKK